MCSAVLPTVSQMVQHVESNEYATQNCVADGLGMNVEPRHAILKENLTFTLHEFSNILNHRLQNQIIALVTLLTFSFLYVH